jgi:ankyrin repeat protein
MINRFNIITSVIFFALSLNGPVLAQTDEQIADFAKAAKFNDVSTVRNLVSKGVDPNILDPKGELMLNLAIRDKSSDVIAFLLTNPRTDVDISNKFGETPLMIASIEGNLPVAKALIQGRKAKVDHIGWTPLHYACAKGQIEIAQYLLANGAIVDSLSPGNTTPLMMAVQSGNEVLVKLLLDKGADLQLRNSQGLSAIDIAVIYEKPWIAEGLLSRWQRLYKQPYKWPKGVEPLKP